MPGILFAGLVALGFVAPVNAVFRLSKALGNDMILQRDVPVTVWGAALPGSLVVTTFAGDNFTAASDATGYWQQVLPPTPAGGRMTSIF